MNADMLDFIDKESGLAEQAVDGDQRKITQVLVINGIKFTMMNKIDQIWHFKDC